MSTDSPMVCCVAGLPGSGKSTLGRALAARLGAAVLDQDVATNPLMARIAELAGAGDDLDHPALRGAVRRARYECLLDLGVDNARIGRPVVMIAPFTAEVSTVEAWAGVTRLFRPVRVFLVWTAVDPAVAWERRRRRNLPRDRAATGPSVEVVPAVPYVGADGAADPAAEARRVGALLG